MKNKQASVSKKTDLYLFVGVLFISLILAACSPGQAPTPAQATATTAPPTLTIPAPELTAPATLAVTPASECPNLLDGTQLLRNEPYGYCFLYPEGYLRVDPLPYEICLVPGESNLACHSANLMLEVEEALGRTAGQAADDLISDAPLPENVQRTNLVVGGEEAVLLDGLGGQDANRRIVMVHDGYLFELWFIPWDEAGDGFARLQTLYDTVINSFTFLHGGVQPPPD